jgi:hypothetical protein
MHASIDAERIVTLPENRGWSQEELTQATGLSAGITLGTLGAATGAVCAGIAWLGHRSRRVSGRSRPRRQASISKMPTPAHATECASPGCERLRIRWPSAEG